MVPGAVLTLAAGLLFGAATGSLLTVVGAPLGATFAALRPHLGRNQQGRGVVTW